MTNPAQGASKSDDRSSNRLRQFGYLHFPRRKTSMSTQNQSLDRQQQRLDP
jgi:hypothetical protein